MRLLALLAPCASALLFDEAAKARPVTKVVQLLQGMKGQLESEAKEEEDLMEKYNCWCKENGEEKEKAILGAKAHIEEWTARVAELAATSSRLETEYKALQGEVDKNQASMDESMAMRKKQVAKFQQEEQDLVNSLGSVKSASQVLEAESGSSFLQPSPAVQHLRLLARQADRLSDKSATQLTAFLQNPSTGSVQGVLDGLEMDFNSSLQDLQSQELQNKAGYEKLLAAKREEIDSAKAQIATKKEEKTAADEERLQKKQALKDARGSMEEDLKFAQEVKEKCAAKTSAWEKRQQTRADETQAVSKAIEVLDAESSHELFGKTMSLLQMKSKQADPARQQQIYQKLLAAGKKHDQRLVTLSLEAKLDGLGQVQEKIDVMIKALKTEQADEVKKKDYCIEELSKNKLAAEDKQRQGESLDASVQDLKQKLQALVAESEELSAEVAELQKQQQLSAQNREKENAEFQKVVQDQRETQVLLKKAMVVLQGFYNKESLLQAVPPVEPETFGSYKKKSGGNGVVMMLQQLVADAQEMETEASAAERSSQLDYEAFGQETTASLAAKNKALEDKAGEKAKLEEKAVMARQSKKGVLAEVEGLANTEFQLHETCDFTLQNFDARQKARGEEVESLHEAKAFLSGAK